jgi:hypothetical protein
MENQILTDTPTNGPSKNEQHLTTAALARPVEQATRQNSRASLFPEAETNNLRGRWQEIQGSFVDEPRQSVERADELVATVISRLAQSFADERSKLEGDWSRGRDVSTEDLRQALQRYRSFFDRLLTV